MTFTRINIVFVDMSTAANLAPIRNTKNVDYERQQMMKKTHSRSLAEIFKSVEAHYQMNPNHGSGCACMDAYVKEIRNQLPAEDYKSPINRKVNSAVSYVLYAAMR